LNAPAAGEASVETESTTLPRFLPYAALVALALHFLFLKLLAKQLPLADFGAVVAAQAFLFAAAPAALALQAASAAFAFAQRGRGAAISPIERFDRIASRAGLLALGFAALFFFVPVHVAVGLPTPSHAAAAPLLAAAALLAALGTGTLLGARRERTFALLTIADPALRLLTWPVLAAFGLGSRAPLFAILIALLAVAVAARARLGSAAAAAAPDPESARIGRMRSPFSVFRGPAAIFTLFAFGLFAHGDVLLARVRLGAGDAGIYAALVVTARLSTLIALPIGLGLVIQVRRALLDGRPPSRPLWRALLLAILPLGALYLVSTEAPRMVASVLLDAETFVAAAPQIERHAVVALVLGLSQIVLLYAIALERISLWLLPATMVPLEGLLFAQYGDLAHNAVSVTQVTAALFAGVLVLATIAVTIFMRPPPIVRPERRDGDQSRGAPPRPPDSSAAS
jgi:hypothetical protein